MQINLSNSYNFSPCKYPNKGTDSSYIKVEL